MTDKIQYGQTADRTDCTGNAGVCGTELQDKLTGALIGLARVADGNAHLITKDTDRLIIEGLYATLTNVSFDHEAVSALIDRVHAEKEKLAPQCRFCTSPCGKNDDFDMRSVWEGDENIRSLKSLILFGIRGIAAYAYHAAAHGCTDQAVNQFFYRALFAIGMDWDMDELLPVALEAGKIGLKCTTLSDSFLYKI